MITKTARILVPTNYATVPDANHLSDETLAAKIRQNIHRKATDVPSSNWAPMLAGGTLGAIGFPILTGPAVGGKGLLAASAIGGLVGAGLGKIQREADVHNIRRAKGKLVSFDNNTDGYREILTARAKNKATEDTQYNALARNERDKELHQRLYGTQLGR